MPLRTIEEEIRRTVRHDVAAVAMYVMPVVGNDRYGLREARVRRCRRERHRRIRVRANRAHGVRARVRAPSCSTVAMPVASVVTVASIAPATVPPPLVTENCTFTLGRRRAELRRHQRRRRIRDRRIRPAPSAREGRRIRRDEDLRVHAAERAERLRRARLAAAVRRTRSAGSTKLASAEPSADAALANFAAHREIEHLCAAHHRRLHPCRARQIEPPGGST